MSPEQENSTEGPDDIRRKRGLGILLVVLGFLALVAPFQATVLMETLIGLALLAAAAVLFTVFLVSPESFWKRMAYLALSVANLVVGALFFLRPVETLLALTLVIIVYLFVSAAVYLISGFVVMTMSDRDGFLMIAAGAASALIAIVLTVRYPETSAVVLGIGAGATLLLEGATLLGFRSGASASS